MNYLSFINAEKSASILAKINQKPNSEFYTSTGTERNNRDTMAIALRPPAGIRR